MGDRANVYVTHGSEPGVFLYTHWAGDTLPETLRAALKRGKGRWSDTPYLTRIIFSEMIKDAVMDQTGYGISAQLGDNTVGRPILVVNTKTQSVYFTPEEDFDTGVAGLTREGVSFTEFIKRPAYWPKED